MGQKLTTHCRRGHERTEENSYISPSTGYKRCRVCKAMKGKRIQHPITPKTHCPSGHPYKGRNLYIIPSTQARVCRACQRIHQKRWQKDNKEKGELTRSKWFEANKERARQSSREYHQKHRLAINTKRRIRDREMVRVYRAWKEGTL